MNCAYAIARVVASAYLAIATATTGVRGAAYGAAAPESAVVTRTIPPAGGVLRLAPLSGFSGTIRLPSNDAAAPATVELRSSRTAPGDAPERLVAALAAVPKRTATLLWLEATPATDVRFDPGDVGFDFTLRPLPRAGGVAFFALVCDGTDCKPREVGPLFDDGDVLTATNAHSPFHFHFAIASHHSYVAVIYGRNCPEDSCNR